MFEFGDRVQCWGTESPIAGEVVNTFLSCGEDGQAAQWCMVAWYEGGISSIPAQFLFHRTLEDDDDV